MTTADSTPRTVTVAESLRQLADFLDAHPEVEIGGTSVCLLDYVNTREELAAIAKRGSWRKVYTSDYFELHRDFGNGITLQVYTNRANVCRRVVIGQRTVPAVPAQPAHIEDVVEWVCEDEPLLAVQS